MKKLIIALILVGSVSSGFTKVINPLRKKATAKIVEAVGIDFSDILDEKRLANWD